MGQREGKIPGSDFKTSEVFLHRLEYKGHHCFQLLLKALRLCCQFTLGQREGREAGLEGAHQNLYHLQEEEKS
jgi:hypothetical protein